LGLAAPDFQNGAKIILRLLHRRDKMPLKSNDGKTSKPFPLGTTTVRVCQLSPCFRTESSELGVLKRNRRLFLAVTCAIWLADCGGGRDPRLSPGGQLILQNITYAPITMLASPLHVSRSSSMVATISAALPTRSVSLDNGNGQCVSGNDSAGLSPGSTQYTIMFTAITGSPANCTQTVTITVDGDPIVFYLLVP